MRIADAWRQPAAAERSRTRCIRRCKKISVDYAVMEPASRDAAVRGGGRSACRSAGWT